MTEGLIFFLIISFPFWKSFFFKKFIIFLKEVHYFFQGFAELGRNDFLGGVK